MSSDRLAGRVIVVTRAANQADALCAAIEAEGGTVTRAPLLEIAGAADGGAALRLELAELGETDWVALTSSNASRALIEALADTEWPGANVAAIGQATADVVAEAGITVERMPMRSTASDMVEEFAVMAPTRVLVPQSNIARSTLVDGLRDAGHEVIAVEAYQNRPQVLSAAAVEACRAADVVTFASPSAVARYIEQVGLQPAKAVCIGPITAEAAIAGGFETVEAETTGIESILVALTTG